PGWQPPWVKAALYGEPFVTPLVDGPAGKYDRRAPRPLTAYAMFQFVLATGATMALLWGEAALGWGVKVGLAVAIVWTVLDVGMIFDGRGWAVPSELLRLGAVGAAVGAWAAAATAGAAFAAAVVGALAFAAVSAAWLLNHRRLLTAAPALRSSS
ncbi:MAG: hypothetical protein NDJ75_10965, partial [Thermoanaerobaculia bacterium]|nr:hypothetical protein [Thermoanaerobaculia bacterium]